MDTSQKMITIGVSGLVMGVLVIGALKKGLLPSNPVKWGVAFTSLALGVIFIIVGFVMRQG